MTTQVKVGHAAAIAAAVVLWLVTAAGALVDLYWIRELFVTLFLRFTGGGELSQAQASANLLVLALALVWIAFVIGTAEYHRKRVGRPESWKLFGWSIAAEIAIAALYWLIV